MEKGVCQSCILSPCLFNFYAEYIMRNTRLDETQSGIKTAKRNINKLRYADDTTLTGKREEKIKSLLMKVREWKNWLKTQHSKNKDHVIQSHHFIFPLWLTIIIIFYFLSGYWLWKLLNIFYYCDYITIT